MVILTYQIKGGTKNMAYIIAFIVSVIWGYFSDLKRGEVGWFIGRVVFVMTATFIADSLGFYQ
jgi:hypothetical protein